VEEEALPGLNGVNQKVEVWVTLAETSSAWSGGGSDSHISNDGSILLDSETGWTSSDSRSGGDSTEVEHLRSRSWSWRSGYNASQGSSEGSGVNHVGVRVYLI